MLYLFKLIEATVHNFEEGTIQKYSQDPFIMKVFHFLFVFAALPSSVDAFSSSSSRVTSKQQTELYAKQDSASDKTVDRRSMLSNASAFTMAIGIGLSYPSDANAQPDCMSDCLKNCKLIAPKVS